MTLTDFFCWGHFYHVFTAKKLHLLRIRHFLCKVCYNAVGLIITAFLLKISPVESIIRYYMTSEANGIIYEPKGAVPNAEFY